MDTARPAGHKPRVRSSRLWMLPLLLAAMVLGSWWFTYRARHGDRELGVYVTGAERMAAGDEIYRRTTDKKPFTYPPFAAAPFVPFSWLPESWHLPAWFCINFLILVAIVRWLHAWARRAAPATGPPRIVWFWVLTTLLGVHYVLSVFTYQSHDLLILGAAVLAAAAWCRNRATAGVWAGLGAATKATPLLFLVLFVLRRRVLAVLLLLAATAGATLLPDLLWPRDDGRWWVEAWYTVNLTELEVGGTASVEGAWKAHSWLNQSLSGTLTRLLTAANKSEFVDPDVALLHLSPGACKVVTLVLQAAVLGAIALGVLGAARAVRRADDPAAMQRTVGLGEVAVIALGMVLLSPQSSKQHFGVWLLPAAFLADRVLRGRRDAWLWLLLAVTALLGPLAGRELLTRAVVEKLNACGNLTWCTVLLLAATVRVLWTAGRGDQPAPGIPRNSSTTSAA